MLDLVAFLAELSVLEVFNLRHDQKETLIKPHKAFLDGFDVLKLGLHRLPANAAKARGSHF